MLEAFETATQDWPREQVHVEYFTPKAAPAAVAGVPSTQQHRKSHAMQRTLTAVVAALVAWVLLISLLLLALRHTIPGYAAAEPTLAFTLSMQLARLTVAAATSVAAGAVAAWVAPASTLAPGTSTTLTVMFAPMVAAAYSDSLTVNSDGGNVRVNLTGISGLPPNLVVTPMNNDFGTVVIGTPKTLSFTLQNTGGVDLTIVKSKPPALGAFIAQTSLAEGSTIAAGQTVTAQLPLRIRDLRRWEGDATGKWVIDSGAYTILVGKNADDAETTTNQGMLTVQGD